MLKPFRTLFFLVVAAAVLLYLTTDGVSNPAYASIHILIIALSLAHIAKAPSFNLGLSFSFFALFFFGIIPLFEYKLGITYQGASVPRDSSYMAAAGLALLSSIFFYIGYGLKKGIPANLNMLVDIRFASKLHYQLLCITILLALIVLPAFIASYYGFDFNAVFFRGYGEEIESTAIGYSFINYFIRPLLFNLIFLIVLIRVRRNSGTDLRVYAFCILSVIFISPVGIPRTLAGALYIPLLVLVFLPKLVPKYSILCIITFAILVAAPVADIFRRVIQPDGLNLAANFNADYFFSGHFDAFHNLVQVIELGYVSDGWQVIGAMLFWVPRAAWPGKPVGTSFDFAEFAGLRAGNVSFSLTADLFVDYGVLGVVLGMLLLGIIYKRLDNYLTRPQLAGSLVSYIFAIAHLELSLLGIYLLRGAFLSSFAFTVGVASTLVTIRLISSALGVRKKHTSFPSTT